MRDLFARLDDVDKMINILKSNDALLGENERPDTGYERPDTGYDRSESAFERPDTSYGPDTAYDRPESSYDRPEAAYDRPDKGYDRPQPRRSPKVDEPPGLLPPPTHADYF